MIRPWFRKKRSGDGKPNRYLEPSYIENLPDYGFSGFKLYFCDSNNLDVETFKSNVSVFQKYIEENRSSYSDSEIVQNGFFLVDYQALTNADLINEWEDFRNILLNNSEYCLNCMGLAMYQHITDMRKNSELDYLEEIPYIHARITNVEPILQLKDLRVNYYGKLVTIGGTVIKAGHVRLICQYLTFTCSSCNGTQLVKQIDGSYTLPLNCPTKNCRAQSKFSPIYSSNSNRTVSWQAIKIQELIGTEQKKKRLHPGGCEQNIQASFKKILGKIMNINAFFTAGKLATIPFYIIQDDLFLRIHLKNNFMDKAGDSHDTSPLQIALYICSYLQKIANLKQN